MNWIEEQSNNDFNSKYIGEFMTGVFADKIPQHRHCEVCGKAFVGDGMFCSDDCRTSAGREAKKKIRKLMLVWVVLVAITVAAIVVIGI